MRKKIRFFIWGSLCLTLWVFAGPGDRTRVEKRFPVAFLTEPVPDFPLDAVYRFFSGSRPLLVSDSFFDDSDVPGGTFSFGEENQPDDVYSGRRGLFSDCGFFPEEKASSRSVSPEALPELMTSAISPESWKEDGEDIEIRGPFLYVRAAPEVLEKTDRLLKAFRNRASRTISVEIALVPIEATAELPQEELPWFSGGLFDRIVEEAGPSGEALSFLVPSGQVVSTQRGNRRAALVDLDINSTGAAGVVNGLFRAVPSGLAAAVRAVEIGDTEWILLALAVIDSREAAGRCVIETPFGNIDGQATKVFALGAELLCRRGGGALAGFLSAEVAGRRISRAVIVRVRTFPPERPSPIEITEGPVTSRFYDVEFVLRRAGGGADPQARLPGTPEDLKTLVREAVGGLADGEVSVSLAATPRTLLLRGREKQHLRLQALRREWREGAAVQAVSDLWILTGKRAQVSALAARAAGDGALPSDWLRQAEELGLEVRLHLRSYGLTGTRFRLSEKSLRRYVDAYECMTGTASGPFLDEPDPVVREAGTGLDLEISVRPLAGDLVEVSLENVTAETTFERKAPVLVPRKVLGGGERREAKNTSRRASRELLLFLPAALDLPDQKAHVFDQTVLVKKGAPVIVEMRSGNTNSDRAFLRILEVSFRPAM